MPEISREYRGIVFDIDGTGVPLGAIEADDQLRAAVRQAQQTMILSAATGRSFGYAHPIFESLGLTHPSVIMGGSAIIDPISSEVVWGYAMDRHQANHALKIVEEYRADVNICTDPIAGNMPWDRSAVNEQIYTIWADAMQPEEGERLSKALESVPNTTSHSTPSWTEDMVDIHITHSDATKEHAIKVLIEKLGLRPDDVIGVGDSGNDAPLFRAVGHRVAMGNGAPGLKALADEIAPSLDEGGLVHVINKYARQSR